MPKHPYIVSRCTEIEDMLDYAISQTQDNPRLGGHLAAHISVLVSGVVEDCIEYLVTERARQGNDPELAEFVRTSIDCQFRNPNSRAVAEMIGTFSVNYRDRYQSAVPTDSREALGSIMSNRLSLAHSGRSQNDFTLSEVKQYFELIVPIIEVVESILLPDSTG